MNVILIFPIQVASIFHIRNLSMTQLIIDKHIDHSPFYSLSNAFSISDFKLSYSMLNRFGSYFLSYYSSFHCIDISQTSFNHFVHTSILVNGESYINQIFTDMIKLESSTNFTGCTFNLKSTSENFILDNSNYFNIDSCLFYNSTIENYPLFEINNAELNIKNTVFTNIQCIGDCNLFSKYSESDSTIKFDSTNFSSVVCENRMIDLTCTNIQISNCIFYQNICKACIINFILYNSLQNQDILNNVIMIQNQIDSRPPSEIRILCKDTDDPIKMNHITVNDEKIQKLTEYRHFYIQKENSNSNIWLNGCCLSNPKEKWINTEFIDDNNSENDDCFDLHPKIAHYGIIGTELVELQIPKRLLKYFPDQD